MTTTTVLAYIPSPPQGVWHLGPFPIRAYALFIIVGIIVGCWWGSRRWRARGGQEGEVLDVAVWAVPFGLIGGRIYHVITDWTTYFGSGAVKAPIDALKIWEGGLGIWGAVAFGALGAWIGCRRHGIKLAPFGDAIAPAILLAQAIGRIGNYFNQELFGGTTTLPWGLEIFDRRNSFGQVGPNVIDGVSTGHVSTGLFPAVHPTFLYELIWNVFVVLVLVSLDRYLRIGHGRLFALYVAGYCVGRFAIELMRTDHASHILGIRVNVFTAAIVFACAAAYFVLAPKGRELGLTMYQPWRAKELEEEGVVGYVDPFADDDDEDYFDGAVAGVGDGGADSAVIVADDDFETAPDGDAGSDGEPDGDGEMSVTSLVKGAGARADGEDADDGRRAPDVETDDGGDPVEAEGGAETDDATSGDEDDVDAERADSAGDEADSVEAGDAAEPHATETDAADADSAATEGAATVAGATAAAVGAATTSPGGEDDDDADTDRIVSVTREIAAPAAEIFELIADPAQQPQWDGNGNLADAVEGQRVRKVGDKFDMRITRGQIRRNHVVEFDEGKLIAWLPSEPDTAPPGHLWRWELTAIDDDHTAVTHTYDWTRLADPKRLERARWTTADKLQASVDRLADLVETRVEDEAQDADEDRTEESTPADEESRTEGATQAADAAEAADSETPNVRPNIVKRADAAVSKSVTDAAPESDNSH